MLRSATYACTLIIILYVSKKLLMQRTEERGLASAILHLAECGPYARTLSKKQLMGLRREAKFHFASIAALLT